MSPNPSVHHFERKIECREDIVVWHGGSGIHPVIAWRKGPIHDGKTGGKKERPTENHDDQREWTGERQGTRPVAKEIEYPAPDHPAERSTDARVKEVVEDLTEGEPDN